MNLLQLVFKNMRQRGLSTTLTLASVALGVALAVALLVAQREGQNLFGQKDFGYDLVVGDKGSKLQLVLNMVYGIDQPPGVIPYSLVDSMTAGEDARHVKWAVPVASTDSLEGFQVLATTPTMLGFDETGQTRLPDGQRFEYRLGQELQLAEGRSFHARKFEAVLGSGVAGATGLGIGDSFQVVHGLPQEGAAGDIHDERWTVVGLLEETGTTFDDYVLQSYVSSLALGSHGSVVTEITKLRAEGRDVPEPLAWPDVMASGGQEFEYYILDPATGLIYLKLPRELWQVSGIFVATRSGFGTQSLLWKLDKGEVAMAAVPADEMITFFNRFLGPLAALLFYVTVLVSIVAATGILVSIYNSVSARRREIAILRSLGATRSKVLAIITIEAVLIGVVGALVGWVIGHVLVSFGAAALQEQFGESVNAWSISAAEWYYLAGVVGLALLAGLVPALKAYSTPVAQNLSE